MEFKTIRTALFPQLSYRIVGKGPAIVLIHGFPENGELWVGIGMELSAHFIVIIPDLPYAGSSTYSGNNLSIEDMADSIKLVCEAEQVDKAVIAGHSMGGYTALAFADSHPEMVKGLSLVHSVATADTEEKKANRQKAIQLVQKGGKDAFIKQMVPELFSETTRTYNEALVKRQLERGLLLEEDAMVAFYNAMINRPDRTNVLRDAGFPVQWIVGKTDKIAPYDVVLQQTKLASVNFISVYEDSAHMSMLEQPESLVKDLKEFGNYCYVNNIEAGCGAR